MSHGHNVSKTINILEIEEPTWPETCKGEVDAILAKYPFAPLIRDSIDQAAPRPLTPFYNDVTIAIQRTWHPPGSVNPSRTPRESNDLISKALKGKVLI